MRAADRLQAHAAPVSPPRPQPGSEGWREGEERTGGGAAERGRASMAPAAVSCAVSACRELWSSARRDPDQGEPIVATAARVWKARRSSRPCVACRLRQSSDLEGHNAGKDQLDRLAAFAPAPYPVVSLYLNTQPGRPGAISSSFVRKEFAAHWPACEVGSPGTGITRRRPRTHRAIPR